MMLIGAMDVVQYNEVVTVVECLFFHPVASSEEDLFIVHILEMLTSHSSQKPGTVLCHDELSIFVMQP
jgi:hypothetical protein